MMPRHAPAPGSAVPWAMLSAGPPLLSPTEKAQPALQREAGAHPSQRPLGDLGPCR